MIWAKSSAQLGKISAELEIGILNGSCLKPYPVFEGCFECKITIQEQRAMVGLATNFGVNIGLTQRHSIGIGCLINELNFEQEKLVSGFFGGQNLKIDSYLLKYMSWHISHYIRLLNGKSMNVSSRNGLSYEKLLSAEEGGSIATHFRERNWGFYTKLEFQFNMNEQNELVLSPIAIFALNNFDNHEYLNTNYRPFRYGLLLGWRTYFARTKHR